jgi:hypothetical protein
MNMIKQPINQRTMGRMIVAITCAPAWPQVLPSTLPGENSGAVKMLSFPVTMPITIPANTETLT